MALYDELLKANNFFLIAGPCVVENEEVLSTTASKIKELCEARGIPFLFKSSYRKANRSKASSFQGIGDEKALGLLKQVGEEMAVPLITDVHLPDECAMAAEHVDALQIPAFLSRQSDLLEAAAETGKIVNIKKGQFLAPESMAFAAEKVNAAGNEQIFLTERGTTFGYQDLVVDMRSIPLMQRSGHPVVMDVTHSLQQPNQSSGVTGGQPEMIETIAKSAIAAGADGIFLETHPKPSEALSDGANMLALEHLESLLDKLVKIRKALN
jgi:2-dehydro-3-deoxyphosphooctonate aldolase (KDO 8-P synthase)